MGGCTMTRVPGGSEVLPMIRVDVGVDCVVDFGVDFGIFEMVCVGWMVVCLRCWAIKQASGLRTSGLWSLVLRLLVRQDWSAAGTVHRRWVPVLAGASKPPVGWG